MPLSSIHPSDRARAIGLTLLGCAVLALGACGRQRGFEALSPPDVAFFHQSTWSAAQGLGFQQTALEFDRGTLLGSIHLSPLRLLWVPIYALLPSLYTLVSLQAVAVGLCIWPLWWWIRRQTDSVQVATIGVLVFGIHPLSTSLATADLRPRVFLVPGAIWAIWGLSRGAPLVVGAGCLWMIGAREEAPLVMLGMLPWAVCCGRRGAGWRAPAVLLAGILLGFALPQLVWGHASNIATNRDPLGVIAQIASGERPVFRWSQELVFGGRSLVAALPALLAPELLLPGLGAWLYLAIFSELEPAAPGQGGLHYLTVVHPFVLTAAALGLARLCRRAGSRCSLVLGGTLLLAVLAGGTELARLGSWVGAAVLGPSERARTLHELLGPVVADDGAVLSEPETAPLLAARPLLRIRGHFASDPTRVGAVVSEVDWVIRDHLAPRRDDPAWEEWDRWNQALVGAGFSLQAHSAGRALWRAPERSSVR